MLTRSELYPLTALSIRMYTVPKLEDYSPAALDRAVADLFAALDAETAALSRRDRLERVPRPLDGAQERRPDAGQRRLAEGRAQRRQARGRPARQRTQGARRSGHRSRRSTRSTASSAGAKLATERLDITLPGIRRPIGVKHPVLRVMDEIVAVFKAMGYSVGEGPEVETDYYNFESLNFPPNHPARDTQDTLFIAGQEQQGRARSPAAAHPYFAGADPHHGEAAAAGAHRHSRQGAPQRSARRHPLAGLPPGRRAWRSIPTSPSAI